MIKLNLLPQYVLEIRRIRVVVIAFLVLLALEAAVVYQAYSDLRKQEAWFQADKEYFTARTKKINDAVGVAKQYEDKSKIYDPYNAFFTRDAVFQYNEQIANAIEESARTIGGDKAWFNDMTVNKDGTVVVHGQITGLMNFLEYYFKMKDKGFSVTPAALPAPSPAEPTMGQEVTIAMAGNITSTLPEMPPVPTVASQPPVLPDKLYIPAGAAPAPAPAP